MTRRLLILRHAKAGPHDEKHDKERQLIDRGRSDSALMGRIMREKGYIPELVLCSSAALISAYERGGSRKSMASRC